MLSACPREAGEAKHPLLRFQTHCCDQGDIYRSFDLFLYKS